MTVVRFETLQTVRADWLRVQGEVAYVRMLVAGSGGPSAMPYVMVDVEADGRNPGDYSMVCFGAVIVEPALKQDVLWPLEADIRKVAAGGVGGQRVQARTNLAIR